ncbi:hypothetical protein ACWIFB_07025 [Dietzia sp. NPDC055340]
MLFGSIDNIFGAVQGSVEAFGGSLGTLFGTGGGSIAGLLANGIEAIYAGSGQEIPPLVLG